MTSRWVKIIIYGLVFLAALALGWLAAARMVSSINYRDSDFFTFYLAGWMNWQGQDPYSIEHWKAGVQQFNVSWMPVSFFPYPLPLAIFLAPLGLLDLYHAFVIWVYISGIFVFLSCSILLVQNINSHRISYLLPILTGAFLFRPTLVTFHDGQLGALWLFLIGCTIFLWRMGLWFIGGILLGMIALKPTIGFPMFIYIGLWLVFKKHFSGLAGLILSWLVLAIIGFVRNMNWISDFLTIGNRDLYSVFTISPSFWGVSSAICQSQERCMWLLGGLLSFCFSLLILYYLWIARATIDSLAALGIAAAAGVIITPYILAYDQILLLITVIATITFAIRNRLTYLPIASYPILISGLSVFLVLIAMRTGRDHWSVLVPLTCLIALIVVIERQSIPDIPEKMIGKIRN